MKNRPSIVLDQNVILHPCFVVHRVVYLRQFSFPHIAAVASVEKERFSREFSIVFYWYDVSLFY